MIVELIRWLRLLPNIKCLLANINELKYWLTDDRTNQYFNNFLQHLDRLYVDCSSIINLNLNEEIRVPFLSYVIDKRRFPQLKCLRFLNCKHISSSWCNIHQWIDFIFTHIDEHQLKFLRFDFIEKGHELIDIQTGDEIITRNELPYIIDIRRFVSDTNISFWIERLYK